MAQSTLFPVRYGLTVPRGENLQSTEIYSEGGLDLTQTVLETRPGYASKLINFEPSLIGGYRRINGFSPYSSTIVPGQGQILGVAIYIPGTIIAARQDASDATKYNVYSSSGTSWTRLNPTTTTQNGTTHTNTTLDGLTSTTGLIPGQPISGTNIAAGTLIDTITGPNSLTMTLAATGSATNTMTFSNPLTYSTGMHVNSSVHNWTGTYVNTFTDGVNYAYEWDGTTFSLLFRTGSAANPAYSLEFVHYLFVSGYSSNFGAIKISAPLNSADWNPVDGAAEIVVGDQITWLASWRQQLIIFCRHSIYRIIGNTTNVAAATPFTLQQITDKTGCIEGRTVQEINGDLIYLSQDGIRTIAGTFNIGDTEIASISRPIQNIVSAINPVSTKCHSVVIHRKTQYRLFYPSDSANDLSCFGIIGSIRRFRNGNEDWEWGQLRGIKPSCSTSGYFADDNEYVVHGGYDGYVYRQESGNKFTFGNASTLDINELYMTVPFEFGDRAYRKVLHRVTIYAITEGSAPSLSLNVIYDLGKNTVIQPAPITLVNIGGGGISWDDGSLYDASGIVVYDQTGDPVYRQNVQGSGFIGQLEFSSNTSNNAPYTIQGFEIEYYPAGRR